MFVSLYWSLRHLLDLLDKSLPWRPAFHKKMSNRFPFAFPKHPGWFVTGELFISGALITTAVFVSFVPTYEFNYDGIAGPAASIIAFFAAIGVGLLGYVSIPQLAISSKSLSKRSSHSALQDHA